MATNLDLAVEAYDAVVAAGGTPASGACAAAEVLGTTPAEALNQLLDAGLLDLRWYRSAGKSEEVFLLERL